MKQAPVLLEYYVTQLENPRENTTSLSNFFVFPKIFHKNPTPVAVSPLHQKDVIKLETFCHHSVLLSVRSLSLALAAKPII